MKVEEPVFVYGTKPSIAHLRQQIVERVEQEENVKVLQQLLVFVGQVNTKNPMSDTPRQATLRRNIVLSDRIKALSAVPPTTVDKDYKDSFADITLEKYL